MSGDYQSGFAAPASGGVLQSVGGIRKDVGGDIAGADGDYAPIQLNSVGAVRVTGDGGKLTYSCAFDDLVGASSCTDLAIINGSSTKTVWVQEVRLSASATAAKTLDAKLLVRSTANSGGTSTAGTAVPHSSDDAAATAAILLYTANPTTGTATGAVRSTRMTISAADAAATQGEIIWDLRGYNGGKGIRLEGTAQGLAINLDGESPGSGNSFSGSITWTEEPTTT